MRAKMSCRHKLRKADRLKAQVSYVRQRNERRENEQKTSLSVLPTEILFYMFKLCITSYPHMRYVIAKLSSHYRKIIQSTDLPLSEIHIGYSVMEVVPMHISVRIIVRRSGAQSGLSLAIRDPQ